MFTEIYVSMQGGRVLQQRMHEEAAQPRLSWLAAILHRATASK